MSQINWNITKKDLEIVNKIVRRIHQLHPHRFDHMSIQMDITACHCNGNPLKLAELLEADTFNFNHDIFGINEHVCRETGKLLNCFVPRFTKQS